LDQALFAEKLADFSARITSKAQGVQELQAQETGADAALQALRADEEAARGALLALDVTGDSLRAKIDQIREDLNSRARQRYERSSRVKELAAAEGSKTEEIGQLQERLAQLSQRGEDARNEAGTLRERFAVISEELSQIERGDDEELRESAAALSQSRDLLRAKEQDLRQVRERSIALKSSLDEIEKQIVSLSPLSQLQKTLGQQGSEVIDRIRANATLFIDALRVPEQHARAVQAVLAERAAFLLSDHPHAIARDFLTGPLKDPRIKKAGLGLGVLRSGVETKSPAATTIPFPALLSLLEVGERATAGAHRLLGGVYLAPSFDEAVSFFEQHRGDDLAGVTVVTPEGEILTDISFFTFPHEGGIIQLRNRADEVRAQLAVVEQQQQDLSSSREAQLSVVTGAEERHRIALRDSQERQARARQLANEQGSARGRLDAAERLCTQIAQDSQRTAVQISTLTERIAHIQDEKSTVEAELAAMATEREQELKVELDALAAEYSQLEPIRKESRQKLAAASQGLEEARRGLDKLRNLIQQAVLDRQRLELEIENVQQRISSEYGTELLTTVLQSVDGGGRLAWPWCG
ncbi:MAG: hypothetical protein EBZ48_12605, partial [Proteobacteria bacterium]|nr:hypothetical protein [Pseudomonadota bacterium]